MTGRIAARLLTNTGLIVALLLAPAIPASAAAPARMHLVFSDDFTSGSYLNVMEFGGPSDSWLAGDWNGDGKDGVAIRRGNVYYFRDALISGPAIRSLTFGLAGDRVLVGDWDGNGTDTLAVRRGATFIFRNSLTGDGSHDFRLSVGTTTDGVLAGDWDGNGTHTIALRRGTSVYFLNALVHRPADRTITFGTAGDAILAGDWNGDRRDTLAIHRGTSFLIRNTATSGGAEVTRVWGSALDRKVFVGDWNGDHLTTPAAAQPSNPRYRVWELVNQQRVANGLNRLGFSTCLYQKYSQPWAQHLASTGTFAHQPLARGRCRTPDAMAENIAAGQPTPEAVMSAWMNSAGHKANILRRGISRIGVGLATGGPYGIYWVQNFG